MSLTILRSSFSDTGKLERGRGVEENQSVLTKERLCEDQRKVYRYEWWHSFLHQLA